MLDHRADTIVALSSGTGRAAISIVRLSGNTVPDILGLMHVSLHPRKAQLIEVKNLYSGQLLDRCLALYFPAPHSYTGEATVEFHLHGSPAVTASVIESLSSLEGVRMAEPGEFTRRALENGKLSLLEAEAVGALIDADVSSQANQALNQLFGHSQKRAQCWRQKLMDAMTYIEANLDFVDESDVEDDVPVDVWLWVEQLRSEIQEALLNARAGERIVQGIKVALVGAPNVGKSSILNNLARREVAIVSPIAGTTRDIVEVRLDIEGFAFTLKDTAGLQETEDLIEIEGIKRAQAAAASADIVLWVQDCCEIDSQTVSLDMPDHDHLIEVFNKIDIAKGPLDDIGLAISAKTGEGIEQLLKALVQFAQQHAAPHESFIISRARHKSELQDCLDQLNIALCNHELEIRAEALRAGARSLGRLIGVIDHEQVLDQLFEGFCIGK